MQSTSRIMNIFLILLLWLTGSCASDRPPSGGTVDITPLQVIWSDPAPSAVNVSTNTIRLTFNHYVTGRQLLKALVISPSIGKYDITIQGREAFIRADNTLDRNRTFILTLDKNLKDNRGNTFQAPYTMAFSTGALINNGTISGKIINKDYSPATNALILAFAEHPETTGKGKLLNRDPDYLIQTDASGVFSFRHLAIGSYRIIALNDRNHDMRSTAGSEEIGLSSMAVVPTGSSDLLFKLSRINREAQSAPISQTPTPSETGSISGTCYAFGKYVIVEAKAADSKASYSTTAPGDRKGRFHYFFAELPSGSYTISAYVPAGNTKPDPKRQWNSGSIDPFQPAEPFGFYPEKVAVRARWVTRNIDITIKNPLQTKTVF